MRREEGYFTVEAAFVMPVCLAVLVLVIYMTFYACGRCRLIQDAMILSIRESSQKSPASESLILAEYGMKRGRYAFFSAAALDFVPGRTAAVEASGQAGAGILQQFFPGAGMGFSARIETPAHDPPEKYRRYRRLTYLAGRILSADEETAGEGK